MSDLGTDPPIACALTPGELHDRQADWRRLARDYVARADRSVATELRLGLRDDAAGVAAAVGLARAEKVCCPFFSFSLEIDAYEVVLKVGVPAGAEGVLAQFAL